MSTLVGGGAGPPPTANLSSSSSSNNERHQPPPSLLSTSTTISTENNNVLVSPVTTPSPAAIRINLFTPSFLGSDVVCGIIFYNYVDQKKSRASSCGI